MGLLARECRVERVVADLQVRETFPRVMRAAGDQDLPVSREVGKPLLCAPIHPCMLEDDNQYIAAALWEGVVRLRDRARVAS